MHTVFKNLAQKNLIKTNNHYDFSPEELNDLCISIVRECMKICEDVTENNDPAIACYYEIAKRFGM